MGSHRAYRERRYAFGKQLLTFRTRAALTQTALAEQIGVHRRSIQNWETGDSYPKAETLQRLLYAFLLAHAFTEGQEREEALALWQLVDQDGPQQLAAFDQAWFERTLAQHARRATPPAETRTIPPEPAPAAPIADRAALIDWGEAISVPALYGRDHDLQTLQQWAVDDLCRVVTIVGLGGIGKSSLAITFAQRAAPHFEVVLFRSLLNGPALADLLDQTIRAVSEQQSIPPAALPDKIARLVQLFRERRCLLILDNFESLLQPGVLTGTYRAGYADYGDLLQRLSEREHRSCLVLTSREKPAELGPLEGRTAPVRSLLLGGLDDSACQIILEAKDIIGTAGDLDALAHAYGGNPLALTLVAEPIRELFGGDVAAFLAAGDPFFNGVDQLLDQQIRRLSAIERNVLGWLAIGREPMDIAALRARSTLLAEPRAWLQTLVALRARHLIERGERGATFTLQPVVMEYITAQLIEALRKEIVTGKPDLLRRYAVLLAQAPEYVRQSQERVIVHPLLQQLGVSLKSKLLVEAQLTQTLAALRMLPRAEQGYGGGNMLNLLVQLRSDLRGLDFSALNVWQAYLADVELPEVDFRGADLAGSRFTEAFKTVVPVAFSTNGDYLATGSIDGEIWLWRVADKQQIRVFHGHSGPVNALAFSHDNRTLASGSSDGLIMLWSVETGARLATLSGHRSRIWSVAFGPESTRLASGSDDQTIKLWSIASGACLATFAEHDAAVAAVAWSPDGALLASASHDPSPAIKWWDVASGSCVATMRGHTADIWSIAFSPDGALLASGSADLTIKLWSVAERVERATLRGHTARIRAVAWSPDGKLLASGSLDQTVKIWDIAAMHIATQRAAIDADATSGVCRATLAENTGPVNGVAWSPDGDTLAGGGELQAIALWSVARSECLALLYGYNSGVLALAFRPDGASLASAGFDRSIRRWSTSNYTVLPRLAGHTGVIYALAFSPDSTRLVSGSGGSDRSIRLWSTARSTCVATLVEHLSPVTTVAWSANGTIIASGSLDWTIKLWSPFSPTSLATLRGHSDGVRALAFSPDSALLASASYDRTVRLWAVASRELRQTLTGHSGPVRSVAFSADGRLVASGSADQTIRLWSVADGTCLAVLSDHSGEVVSLAFSKDGALLASGSFDGTIRLWNVAAAVALGGVDAHHATLHPQAGVIYAVAFNRDGRTLASGSAEGMITLWDLSTLQPITVLRGDAPYAGMQIAGSIGLTDAQRATLRSLGAQEGLADTTPTVDLSAPVSTAPAIVVAAPAQAESPASAVPNLAIGLPLQPTLFVGRDTELAKIAQLLSDPACRLLTLLGPGGIGKTRLALAVAAAQSSAFADGVAVVALAAVTTPLQIVSAIADAIQLTFAGQPNPSAHLLSHLRTRHMLIILDNFEHLLAGVDLVYDILTHAPRVKILITSRIRLNLQAEWLYDIEGLAYPPIDQRELGAQAITVDPTEYSAVQLFVQRAAQVQPGFVVSEAAITTIVRICRHVAGMPLAIELAAAGLRTLPLSAIEHQIHTNMDVLATTLRDVPARHRSMRAVFEHSWNLLSEPEQTLFRRLAVFRGSFAYAAAAAVQSAELGIPIKPQSAELLTLLTALVDKSLLRQINASPDDTAPDVSAEPRFVLLEPIREYALERLIACGEAAALQRAHALHYLVLAEAAAAQWDTPQLESAYALLAREHDNMRAALQWARDGGDITLGLQLAGTLWRFWRGYGAINEGRGWLANLLALADPSPTPTSQGARLRALNGAAWLASDQHDFTHAAQLFEQSMALRRTLNQTEDETNLLLNAARQARAAGQYQRAAALLEDALSRHRALGDRGSSGSGGLGLSLYELALVLREQGDFARAAALYNEGVQLHRDIGDREGMTAARMGLGDVARDQGNIVQMRAYGEECLAIFREMGIQWAIGFALNNLALAAYLAGDLTHARTLIGESAALFRGLKDDAGLAEVLLTLAQIVRAQGDVAAAHGALQEALRLAQVVGPRLVVVSALEGLAGVMTQPEQAAVVARLLATAAALRAHMGTPVRPIDRSIVEHALATARATLGDDAFAGLWAEGQAQPLEQILSLEFRRVSL